MDILIIVIFIVGVASQTPTMAKQEQPEYGFKV
jgi:hypothetical protein